MSFKLFKTRNSDSVEHLYSGIVRQARNQHIYRAWNIPDSIEGRFDMLVLHLVLILIRLEGDCKRISKIKQDLMDIFFVDLEGNLRELGVSDLRVPKKIKTMAEAFYGRSKSYKNALEKNDSNELYSALKRNLFPNGECINNLGLLVLYVQETLSLLNQQDTDEIISGSVNWLNPSEIEKKEMKFVKTE